MKVLALSSSRVGGGGYLEEAKQYIGSFLGNEKVTIAFVPYASLGDHEQYTRLVQEALSAFPYQINTVTPATAKETLQKADVIMIGGGNTFKLLHDLYAQNLFELIRSKVMAGTPYIGWSAGSNLTGKTICTTNDMPIIQPKSFEAFGFFPFQLNPHYVNLVQKDYHGETRDQRLEEFVLLNPGMPVIGLPEGTALIENNDRISYAGKTGATLFRNREGNCIKTTIEPDTEISDLTN